MTLSSRIAFAIFAAVVAPIAAVVLMCLLLLANGDVFAPGRAIKFLLDGAGIHTANAVSVVSAVGAWWLVIVAIGAAWDRRDRSAGRRSAKIYRFVPVHTLTICTDGLPAQVRVLLHALFRGRDIPVLEIELDSAEVQLEVRPARSLLPECAIAARITPSVKGSNVRARIQVPPAWWGLFAISGVSGLVAHGFDRPGAHLATTVFVGAVLLFLATVGVIWRAIARSVALVRAALRPVVQSS